MSKALLSLIAERQGEIDVAKVIGEAIDAARAILKKAGVEEIDDALQTIVDAALE